MIIYVDASAVLKLIVEVTESARLARYLNRVVADGHRLVSFMLLHTELRTELHCAARRRLSRPARQPPVL